MHFEGCLMQVTPLNEQSSHEVLYNNSVIHSNEVDYHVSFKLHHLFCGLILTKLAWNKLKLIFPAFLSMRHSSSTRYFIMDSRNIMEALCYLTPQDLHKIRPIVCRYIFTKVFLGYHCHINVYMRSCSDNEGFKLWRKTDELQTFLYYFVTSNNNIHDFNICDQLRGLVYRACTQ